MELIRALCPICGHRYKTHARLESQTIPCPRCGKIISVERDYRPVPVPAPPPPSPLPRSEWSFQGFIKKGILFVLLGTALFLFLRDNKNALVSFDNGLAESVELIVDGKLRHSFSPGEIWNQQLKLGYHSIKIQRIDSSVMERNTIFCDDGHYIYNIGGAHQYEIQYNIYVTPEARHKSRFVPAPQRLKKALFFRVEADIPLGNKPPSEIELPEGNEQFTLTNIAVVKTIGASIEEKAEKVE